MANADKCHLIIPFKSYLMTLADAVDDEGRINKQALKLAGQREFENYKAIERRINDPDCNGGGGDAPLAQAVLAESSSTDVLSSVGYTTSSFEMQPGNLYLLSFSTQRNVSSVPVAVVTHSGGATFTEINTATYGGSDGARVTVFRCQPTTYYGAGTLNLTTAGSVTLLWGCWHIVNITGAYDDSANNGAAAILNYADRGTAAASTSSTLTLPARVTTPDAIFATFAIGSSNTTATPGSGFRQMALSSPAPTDNQVLLSEYKPGDNTSSANASWSSNTQNQGHILAIRGTTS